MESVQNVWRVLMILVVGFTTGCGSDTPNGILEIEAMIPIVKDLQIAYAGVDATIPNPNERPEKYEEMNTLILAKHQMAKETFFNSFSYYQDNPILMDSIFKNVVDEINLEIVELDNKGGQKPINPAPEVK